MRGAGVLQGRTDELQGVSRLFDRLGDGPSVLLIEGEAGIGKTTLFEAGVSDARLRGMRVMRSRPNEAEVRLSHAGLMELFDGVEPELVDELPGPQRDALRVALRWDAPGTSGAEPQTVAAAVATFLERASQRTPVLIAIDDLHWLDRDSAHAVEFALRRHERLPVGVLAAARAGEGPQPRPFDNAVPESRAELTRIAPLDPDVLAAILTERFGTTIQADIVQRIHRASAGNPFVALELGRAMLAGGIPGGDEELPLPEDVRVLIARRLRALPDATQAELLEAALTPSPAAPPLDAAALAPAQDASIVRIGEAGAVGFNHPLYASVVVSSSPRAARRAVHARLAARADDVETRGRHLALASEGPSARAAVALDAAAAEAELRGAIDVAAELSERAWRLTPEGDRLGHDRATLAASRYLRAGVFGSAERLLAEILPALEGPSLGRALRLLGDAKTWEGWPAEAIPHFEEALLHLRDESAERATLHAHLAFTYYWVGQLGEEGWEHAHRAVDVAERAGSPDALSQALTARSMVRWMAGAGIDEDDLRRASELSDGNTSVPVQFRPRLSWGTAIGYSGDTDRAVDLMQADWDRANLLGLGGDIPFTGNHLVTMLCWHGELDRASEVAGATLRAAEQSGSPLLRVMGLSAVTCIRSLVGEPSEARGLGAAAIEGAAETQMPLALIWPIAALTKLELSLGDPSGAYQWCAPMLATLPLEAIREPATLFFLPDGIEALVGIGELDRAETLLDAFEERSLALGRLWARAASRRCRALLLAAQGDVEAAWPEAAASVAEFAGLELPIELGRSYLVLGQIERRRRQRGASREALESSAGIFEDVGAVLWTRQARAELDRTWAPRQGGLLTASEERIAGLAADGLTNSEIAARLVMSRRTVEATLSRVYRKLAIRGRAELGRSIAAEGEA